MPDTKISALPTWNPASADLLAGVDQTGPTTKACVASAVGCWILLEEHTVAAAAELDFTTRNVGNYSGASFNTDFDDYVIRVTNFVNNSTASLGFQFSTNGGASYDTGSNYDSLLSYVTGASSAGGVGSIASTSIFWRPTATTALAANGSWNGEWRIANPLGTSFFKDVIGQLAFRDGTSGLIAGANYGEWKSTSAANAVRILPSTGTITGTARLYGIRK